jgi:predicted anti-sigma-YlaC factor YlaD
MKYNPAILQKLLNILPTESEIDCDECFEQVDHFAELIRSGKPAAEIMPVVEEHLRNCSACREEFEALLAALQDSQE